MTADAYSSTKDALKKIRNLHKFAKTLRDASKRDAVTQRLKPIEEALQHSSALKFATGSGYIRFMLGHVNVKVFTVTEKNMLRDECVTLCLPVGDLRQPCGLVIIGSPHGIILQAVLLL